MRVIAGTARRLLLKTPEGADTRPTTDRIKETLFNMLMPVLPGAVFVDLFAGSGGIGIEALSRGAARAYFVENSQKAVACITDNIAHTHFQEKAVVLRQDVFSALSGGSIREPADIIFLDPPYRQQYERRVLELLCGASFVTVDTLIIAETALDTTLDDVSALGFYIEKEKQYKTNKHIFIRKFVDSED